MKRYLVKLTQRKSNASSSKTPIPSQEESSSVDSIDLNTLESDPGLRKKISEYHPNLQDDVRRAYLLKGPCQPRNHSFPLKLMGDTTATSLKNAIEHVLGRYGLSLSSVRGQGYDGASNMRGEFNGLKALIMRDNKSAYYIHCFAHQLQLTLVAVAKNHSDVSWFFSTATQITNVITASCKRRDTLREKQAIHIVEALSHGDIQSGRGLNQEICLKRAGDTRWGSHYGCLINLTLLFSSVVDVLDDIYQDGTLEQKGEARGLLCALRTFDFVLVLHLMTKVLAITNELSIALQRRDQDIVNAMSLATLSKQRLQHMRDEDLVADHVTWDIKEGIAKLGDLRFRVLDSAGLETAASSGSILSRTTEMTGSVLARTQFAIFLIDVRAGLQPLDLEVGKWLRKNAPGIRTILAMNKAESLDDGCGVLTAEAAEAHALGFGDPIAISAETGLGMAELYEALCPLLEDYMLQSLNDKKNEKDSSLDVENEENKLPMQLAIVGRPNVGKSTLLNALLQEERVLVGPEAGLTRDSVRAQFKFDGRTIYLVDTAGWLQRCGQEKGPASLSVMQSRKNLMRAHVVALVLDAEEIANNRCSMKHAETIIARQAVEEGRGLVVVVNKMDLLNGRRNLMLYEKVINAVPKEIQTVIPQVTGIPVVFISALEGKVRMAVLHQIVNTYENWCLRLPTSRLNRWLQKVMGRHSWKDQATQPKIKYFTQVKARPPTFVAFLSGKAQLSDSYIRFLTKSLVEDFNLGGIPIRVMQRQIPRKVGGIKRTKSAFPRVSIRPHSDKRSGDAVI